MVAGGKVRFSGSNDASGALNTGVTSALRLHDATNAYLLLCHGAAKEAANGLVSKKKRISLSKDFRWRLCVDHLVWDFCAPVHCCASHTQGF